MKSEKSNYDTVSQLRSIYSNSSTYDEFVADACRVLCLPITIGLFGHVRVSGKQSLIGFAGLRILDLLMQIVDQRNNRAHRWMIRIRPVIRNAETIGCSLVGSNGCRRALSLVIRHTEDDHVRVLAIWLRGRLGGASGTMDIAQFRFHTNWRNRKEVARALKRMQAWHYLREMVDSDVNPKVRAIAIQKASRPFSERLRIYSSNVSPLSNRSDETGLFVDDSVSFKVVHYPKSIALIRHYLKSIRNAVAGFTK